MRIGSVTVHSSLFAKMASESPEKDLITQSNIVKATDEMIQFEEKTVLDTEKANLNKLRGMQHRKVAHRAYRR